MGKLRVLDVEQSEQIGGHTLLVSCRFLSMLLAVE